jgi:hypothetical protein
MADSSTSEDSSISELRDAARELKAAVSLVREQRGAWQMPQSTIMLPSESSSWNFTTFEKYINQRFGDLSLQLRERYEAQQTGVTAALAAAEKAVNAALIAAEKAVDKAEGAQQLRNEAQNEFRKSLSDLSGLMWTTKEGSAAVESMRREFGASQSVLDNRVVTLEKNYANLQGRIWAISAIFAIVALVFNIGLRFVGH